MRFSISEEQANMLAIIKQQKVAAANTLNIALNHHDQVHAELFLLEEETWNSIIEEHNLDTTNHNWEITYDLDIPYVSVMSEHVDNQKEG